MVELHKLSAERYSPADKDRCVAEYSSMGLALSGHWQADYSVSRESNTILMLDTRQY
jgi:hypothetical protein